MIVRNALAITGVIFSLGLLMLLVVNPALKGFIAPALLAAGTPEVQAQIAGNYDFILTMVNLVPYILFFVAIVYLIVIVFRRERYTQYV